MLWRYTYQQTTTFCTGCCLNCQKHPEKENRGCSIGREKWTKTTAGKGHCCNCMTAPGYAPSATLRLTVVGTILYNICHKLGQGVGPSVSAKFRGSPTPTTSSDCLADYNIHTVTCYPTVTPYSF